MKNMQCVKCGLYFDSEDGTNICKNCRRKFGTNIYSTFAVLLLVFGIILGIYLGNKFPNIDINNGIVNSFNTSLMLMCWFFSTIISIFLFAIRSICYRLDLLIDQKITNN